MNRLTRVTVLVENTAGSDALLAEHGLALWIEAGRDRVLFDTGQGEVIEHNAECLGVDLASTGVVVLSHRDYDHVGGLAAVVEKAPQCTVYAHPAAGVHVAGQLFTSRRPEEVARGVYTTGEVKRVTDFEPDNSAEFPDDQALFFEVDKGIVVAVGCAHAGIINTLEQVAKLTNGKKIHAVLGGMHLLHASDERLSRTVDALRPFDLDMIAPCHCTGQKAVELFEREFPEAFVRCRIGTVIRFGGNGDRCGVSRERGSEESNVRKE